MGTGPPSTRNVVYGRSAGTQPRLTRIYRPIGQEREPNYSGVQSGSLSPLRAAPLEEAGNGGRSVAHIPSAPRVQTHRRHRPHEPAARSRPLRQLSPAPQHEASPEALPPRAWSLPRQLFPPARMSKRRDVPIRVFMPFIGIRTVGCPVWARCSVSGDPSHQLNPIVPSAHVEEDLLPTGRKTNYLSRAEERIFAMHGRVERDTGIAAHSDWLW
jgi:hypothetical protein